MKSRTYDTFLFDWDGTIVQSLDLWLKVFEDNLSKRGLNISADTIKKEVFGSWEYVHKLGIVDVGEFMESCLFDVNRQLKQIFFYPHIIETIQKIKKFNKEMAIVTSAKKTYVYKIAEILEFDIDSMFDVVIGMDEVIRHKPDPEPLYKALELINAEDTNILMIGDSASDIGAAHNANVDSVAIFHPLNQSFYNKAYYDKLQPTYLFNNPKQLLSLI